MRHNVAVLTAKGMHVEYVWYSCTRDGVTVIDRILKYSSMLLIRVCWVRRAVR